VEAFEATGFDTASYGIEEKITQGFALLVVCAEPSPCSWTDCGESGWSADAYDLALLDDREANAVGSSLAFPPVRIVVIEKDSS
jgi:hypothetical protein